MSELLKAGDIFELTKHMTVYTNAPNHFAANNRKGDWDLTTCTVNPTGDFEYLIGKYIVTSTSFEGGGCGHGRHDVFPDGHKVIAKKSVKSYCTSPEISFYQSGCFRATNKNVPVVGHAKQVFIIDDPIAPHRDEESEPK